jgi:hypothetical protein
MVTTIRRPVQDGPNFIWPAVALARDLGYWLAGIVSRKQESDQKYEMVRGLSSPRVVPAHFMAARSGVPTARFSERVVGNIVCGEAIRGNVVRGSKVLGSPRLASGARANVAGRALLVVL